DQAARDGAFVRAIGEVEFGSNDVAVRNWGRYESLLNRAFASRSGWIVCPYDTASLSGEIVAVARRTHPTTSTLPARAPSPAHFDGQELGAPVAVAEPLVAAREQTYTEGLRPGDLVDMRRNVRWDAQSEGLAADVIDDVLLAVT